MEFRQSLGMNVFSHFRPEMEFKVRYFSCLLAGVFIITIIHVIKELSKKWFLLLTETTGEILTNSYPKSVHRKNVSLVSNES